MSRLNSLPSRAFATVALAVVVLGPPPAVRAGSTRAVTAIGDAAPGGGLFAGPGFSGWPSAAGDSWIAFRTEVTGGNATEALVVAHMKTPVSRAQVATLGQASPGRNELSDCAGTFKQFIGRPIVNRRGEVAFLALIQPAADPSESDAFAPLPAGIFLFRGNTLTAVACSGQLTPAGRLDLVAVVDPSADPSEVADRSPALNDAGTVAYLAGLIGTDGPAGAAIFSVPLGGANERVVGIDDPFDGGAFQSLGPPALNNGGTLAFRGQSTASDGAAFDGIFTVASGTISLLVRGGITPAPLGKALTTIEDAVSLNDAGDVAFLAGPVLDDSGVADTDTPAVLVSSAKVVTLLGYPGQRFGETNRIVSVGLGGSTIAPPTIAPDGSVVFFVSLTDGEAIAHWDGKAVTPLVFTGGPAAEATPAGGIYAGAESAPAADGSGGVVFLTRIAGGSVSEALVYRAGDGTAAPIVVGEGAPGASGSGFYGGNPFSAPVLNDRGDVVFRAFLARAPASVGIFRDRDGRLEPVVRAGELSPEKAPILDLVGEPSLNQAGAIAFAADVQPTCSPTDAAGCRARRGIFVAENGTLRTVAVSGAAAPSLETEPGSVFNSLRTNPTINDDGAVAFHGFTLYRDELVGTVKHEAIFLADVNGVRVLLYRDDPSVPGGPLLKLRDAFLTNLTTVAYRASLGDPMMPVEGIFVSGASGTRALAVGKQDAGGGLRITGFNGEPVVAAGGEVAFGVTRARRSSSNPNLLESLGPAILKQSGDTLAVVVARNMPGPAGGTFRSFGPPSMSRLGHVAFRATFLPSLGGVPGLFFHDGTRLQAHVLRGDRTPLGGRFASFGAQPAINANDELAFTASVTQGRARSGIFLTSPTSITTEMLLLRLKRARGHDRIRLRASLSLGRVSDGIDPQHEPVVVSLMDGTGMLWSVTIPGRNFRAARRGAFVATPGRRTSLGRELRRLRLNRTAKGTIRVRAGSGRLDLTNGGNHLPEPPFALGIQVGDDAAIAPITCIFDRRGGRCHA
jgi:hypothetical protein